MKSFKYKKYCCLLVVLSFLATWIGCNKKSATKTEDNTTDGTYQSVTAQEADTLIEQNKDNPDFIILDVRTPGEFNRSHIAGAQNIDFYNSDFESNLEQLDKTKIYFVYCASGNRSGKAMKKMKSLNFRTVYNLLGGISGWTNAGYDVVTP